MGVDKLKTLIHSYSCICVRCVHTFRSFRISRMHQWEHAKYFDLVESFLSDSCIYRQCGNYVAKVVIDDAMLIWRRWSAIICQYKLTVSYLKVYIVWFDFMNNRRQPVGRDNVRNFVFWSVESCQRRRLHPLGFAKQQAHPSNGQWSAETKFLAWQLTSNSSVVIGRAGSVFEGVLPNRFWRPFDYH